MSAVEHDILPEPEEWVVRMLELPKDFKLGTKCALPDEHFERAIAYEACIVALLNKLAMMHAMAQAPGAVLNEITTMSVFRKMYQGGFASQLQANRENR